MSSLASKLTPCRLSAPQLQDPSSSSSSPASPQQQHRQQQQQQQQQHYHHYSSHHHLGGHHHHHHHHHHGGGHLKVVRGSRDHVLMERRGSLPAPENFSREQTTYLVHSASAASLKDVVPVLELPAPPDGGWGWAVVAASFLCNLVIDGIAYSFGVLLPHLVAHYGESCRGDLAWVGSLLAGVYQISGPVAGGLVNKFGCRAVCMAGGVVSCLALLLSTRCSGVLLLALTYGILGGFGLGLVYLPSVAVCGYYFERRRALATGIAVCGSGAGAFIFPPLATALLSVYGWKGAVVIFAGLCLNCCVFGALMRPLELVIDEPLARGRDEEEEEEEDDPMMEVQLPDGTRGAAKRGSVCSAAGALGLPKIPSIILTPHHSLSLLNEEIAEEDDDDDDGFEEGSPMTMVAGSSPPPPPPGPMPMPGPRRRTVSESPSPLLKNLLTPSLPLHLQRRQEEIRRNMSTPGFGRLARMTSSSGGGGGGSHLDLDLGHPPERQQDHIIFGVDEGSRMALRPSVLGMGTALVRPMSRKDVFYGGSVLSLASVAERRKQQQLQQGRTDQMLNRYRHSVIATPRDSISGEKGHPLPRGSIVASHLSIRKEAIDPDLLTLRLSISNSLLRVLREMVDVRIFTNPLFSFFCLAHFLGFLGLYVPFVYLPSMMVSASGLSLEEASWAISAIGISNTLGRVVFGWLIDRRVAGVGPLAVTNASLAASAACLVAMPFCSTFPEYLVLGLLLGLSVSSFISLTSIVLVDLLGLDALTSSFGLLVSFRGVSAVLGPPLAGAALSATGHSGGGNGNDYSIVFFVAAGLFAAGATCGQVAHSLNRIRTRRREESRERSGSGGRS